MDTIEHGPHKQTADEFKRELRRYVDERIDALQIPTEHIDLLDARAVAGHMIASIPALHLHPYDEAAGPFYDSAGLEKWLGVSRQAINKRVHSGTLISARLGGGKHVYPAWQFMPNGQVYPALLPAWLLLRKHSDAWTAILWLSADDPELDGHSAADWLTSDRDPEPVYAAARADVARWSA
ncbi:hypothetical protein [Tomitella gaofuii]|uniref:hypothetical protein n=1 Tax=Tomitella gaofuii TaxID=2760083 RepID=UPI001F41C8D6|nr:hypothetical protein [Tomitella gaofuii]